MILVPYFANSYGFNFEKKCKPVPVHPTVVPDLAMHKYFIFLVLIRVYISPFKFFDIKNIALL